jgi:SAM-dependent methyltransferase
MMIMNEFFPFTGYKTGKMRQRGKFMTDGKRDFDSAAERWDEDPGRVRLANGIADAILEDVELTPDMDALDFGCGTGLVTLRLQPFVRSITAVDGSQGMLDVLGRKISRYGLSNVRTRLVDTEAGGAPWGEGLYHLIVSSMTFHHIGDIKSVLDQFSRAALPGACLCVADLDMEDGLFHGDNTGVAHFGFDRAGLERMLTAAGFEQVRHRTAATVTRPAGEDKTAEFSVFLMTGRKRV